MLVSDLLAYDLVPSEVAALRQAMPERLLPLQEQAVRRGLLGTADFLIVGPAGSGKSTLAKLALAHAEHLGQRALLIRPEPGHLTLRRLALQPSSTEELLSIELFIIDELEVLRDAEQEALLSRLLKRLAILKERRDGGPRLLAFSAPVDGLARLATELRASLVEAPEAAPARSRCVGTLCDGQVVTAGLDAVEPRSVEDLCLPVRSRGQLGEMLAALGRRGPTLVLAPDEASCVRLVSRFVSVPNHDFAAAPRAQAELGSTADGSAKILLGEALRHGVAFQGPSLSPRQQGLVERALLDGEVRLLFAPLGEAPRLALLQASFRHVVLAARWRWQRDSESGRLSRLDLDSVELSRLSALSRGDGGFGPVLVYARSPREVEEIWQQQIAAPPRPLPALAELPRRTAAELLWRRWAEANRDTAAATSTLELLCLTALGPFALPLPLLLSEQPGADYVAKLAQRAAALQLTGRPLFAQLRSGGLSHETLRAVKRALLLADWTAGVAGVTIEDTYHIWVGTAARLASDSADRLEALSRVCAAAGWSERARQPLGDLAARLRERQVDAMAHTLANTRVEHRGARPTEAARPEKLAHAVSTLVGALRAKEAVEQPEQADRPPLAEQAITRQRRR